MEKDLEKMTKTFLLNFFVFFCVVMAIVIITGMTLPAFAQIGGGNPCPGGEPCNPEDVPISGIEWLLVVGGLFGFRKIYHKFKRSS